MTGPSPAARGDRIVEARRLLEEIRAWPGPPVTFMEVCGTHTHAIAEAGLRRRLPDRVRLISGPGCPVCVTPLELIDKALAIDPESAEAFAALGLARWQIGQMDAAFAVNIPVDLGRCSRVTECEAHG